MKKEYARLGHPMKENKIERNLLEKSAREYVALQ